jgi:hypothetical protein
MSEGIASFTANLSSVSAASAFQMDLSAFLKRNQFHPTTANFLDFPAKDDGDFESSFSGSYSGSKPFTLRMIRTKRGDHYAVHAFIEWHVYGFESDIQNMKQKVNEFSKALDQLANKRPNQALHTNGSPGGLFKSAVIASSAQSRMLLPQPPRLRLSPLCCHLPLPESRG